MTEYKVGDKVRVEIEGEVASSTIRDGRPVIVMGSEGEYVARVSLNAPNDAVKITKIVELPTKTGALLYPVDPAAYIPFVRDQEGKWAILGGPDMAVSENIVCLHLERGNYYVAFEGVEE